MDGPLKELAKLEKLTADNGPAKGKSQSVTGSLDSLLQSLRQAKDHLQAGSAPADILSSLSQTVESKKKDIDERQKEIHSSLNRYNKALDKKFSTALPSYPPLFTSGEARSSLERTIALHFLRTGQFKTAKTFIEESGVDIDPSLSTNFIDLYRIITALRQQDIAPALEWTARNREFLYSRSSALEFQLHRSQYIRLLLDSHPPDIPTALAYARANFPPFYAQHDTEIKRLMSCVLYLPSSRLTTSPYADLASPAAHSDLEPMFAKEYCASLGMSRQVPLRVVGDIGGGGALARIEKGRKVMRERKSEWSQSDELPIEIPLPSENRYHSIFACPVSKEQSTEQNPPMMMSCGHVISKDSLQKLSKPGGPERASSPVKVSRLAAIARANELLDDSRNSHASAQERIELTPDEFEFLDAVIERADKTATTFLTVFKAYSDLLHERGMDSRSEVAYYTKLLKLGTLKGTWGDKWDTIKRQHSHSAGVGPSSRRVTRVTRNPPAASGVATRLTTVLNGTHPDTFTLHSHHSDTEASSSDPEPNNILGYGRQLQRLPSPTLTTMTSNSLGLDIGPSRDADQVDSISRVMPFRHPVPSHRLRHWDSATTEASAADTVPILSPTPPSYGAATRGTIFPPTPQTATRPRSKTTISSRQTSSSPPPLHTNGVHVPLPQTRERRKSVLNEDDAWKKIQEEQDLLEADRFREERLLERCWEVWKQGYQWIVMTNQQIADARDHLILRRALQRWRTINAERHEMYQNVSGLSDTRCLKAAFDLWKSKLKKKRQTDWRNAMRARMNLLREKRELKLKKDAWAKWRQSYQSHLSSQHYSERLVLRFFKKWKSRMGAVEQMDAAAEHFEYMKDERQLERCWDIWKKASDLRRTEKVLVDRVEIRIVAGVLDVWKKRLHENHVADRFYDKIVIKRALGAWKGARDRIRVLENRASKHIVRQNDVLIRAVMRVWKAHERGRLLERVKTSRLLKQSWAVWKKRIEWQKTLEVTALSFSMRPSSSLASDTLKRWHQVYTSHHNAQAFAIQYQSAQLQFKMLLAWRQQLRAKRRMLKQAKIAQKFFIMRNYWQKWALQLEERRRKKKLQEFERRVVKKYFAEWLETAQRQRHQKLAEQIISRRIAMRITSDALVHWTNRVADIKFQELDVTQKYDKKLLAAAFGKWKTLCIRHVEELSLMASYQDVKREENMRKMFYRWLTAARKARHRRLLLQHKEEEIKFQLISVAWDKWRERFLDLRLQPVADNFILQSQRNMMFRAFGIWLSKTKTLPAVRFHSFHLKAKAWKAWRDAMPRALQAKTAREMERKAVLSKAYEKWVKAYRTKIELKAVARARYLRLPTVARQIAPKSRPFPAPSQNARLQFPSRDVRHSSPAKDESDDDHPPPVRSRTPSGKFGIASLLTSRPRSPERPEARLGPRTVLSGPPTRPKLSTRASSTRDLSPVRPASSYSGVPATREHVPRPPTALSTASGGELGPRSSLRQELRELQLRSRPLMDRSQAAQHS
ncbi:hypothetical protein OBBRIDRAFT_816423 [Obba rivulosa]|uniref:GID complex catalytic subunit 2 n=1 Tax=Obba rivulosa TaxID=1052685 RepID=A0A8E2DTH3_9APHY|nr:hypothetical protein OBBRIDRAFT_816423 [Obba rivulosa]